MKLNEIDDNYYTFTLVHSDAFDGKSPLLKDGDSVTFVKKKLEQERVSYIFINNELYKDLTNRDNDTKRQRVNTKNKK